MNRARWRQAAPYAPLAAVLLAVYILCAHRLEPVVLLLRELLLCFGYCAALGDIRKQVVPNRLVLMMLGAWVLVLIPQLFLHTQRTVPLVLSALAGAAVAGAVFLSVYLISRGGLGGGDVKFMTAAGLYLGGGGVLPVMLTGSILAAAAGLTLIALKKMDRKGTMALIPFLYVGIVLTALFR